MILKKPKFWKNLNLISLLLFPLSLFILVFSEFKNYFPKRKFLIKSICIGNINVGGTGKTSLVLTINKILKKKYRSVVIKKNYLNQKDEQRLINSRANLICSKTRSEALTLASKNNYEIALLDDGLQEKTIIHDLSIVCFNSSEGIGNGFILPAGPLRESLNSLKNYNAVVLCGEKRNTKLVAKLKLFNKNLEFFDAKYIPNNLKKVSRKNQYLVFSGLGNPEEFTQTLKKYKFKIVKNFVYPDHYQLSNREIKYLKYIAKKENLKILTTEKDYFRIEKKHRKDIKFLSIDLELSNSKKFLKFISNIL